MNYLKIQGSYSSIINLDLVQQLTKSEGMVKFWFVGEEQPICYKTSMSINDIYQIIHESKVLEVD